MAFTQYWNHNTVTGDSEGRAVLQSTNPNGTHAFAGGGWLGGSSTSTDVQGLDAAGAAPILAQYPIYVAATDTTYWMVMFSLAPGATSRAHAWAMV